MSRGGRRHRPRPPLGMTEVRMVKKDISKRLYLDIETTPDLGYAFKRYEAKLFEIQRDWHIQCVAWKWSHEDKVKVAALPDFKYYKKHPFDDSMLMALIWGLLNEAELVVTHNGDRFDLKKLNTRFILADLDPPRPFKTVDTLKLARKHFGFSSNSLDELCRQMGLGRKIKESAGLWKRCEEGDMKAWKERKEYNMRDVELGDKLYKKLVAWTTNFPVLHPDNGKCRKCGSSNLQKRGHESARNGRYQRYQCIGCGSWSKGPLERQDWDINQ